METVANNSIAMSMLCMSGKMMDPRVMSTMKSELHFPAASEGSGTTNVGLEMCCPTSNRLQVSIHTPAGLSSFVAVKRAAHKVLGIGNEKRFGQRDILEYVK